MNLSRRYFIKSTGIALGSFPFVSLANNYNKSSIIKVGLVGCGGRGIGAASQALSADENVVITALADVFPDQIEQAVSILSKKDIARVQVSQENKFFGFDAYKSLIDSGVDVVLLCSPPNFRPDHFEYAVQKGKHIFCEKPVAVDIPGVKRVLEMVKVAREKKLNVVSGFCFRYSNANREIMKRVEAGSIGDIKSIYTFRMGGELTLKNRKPEWTDLEYQLRNWVSYQRYSGDLIIEQSIHSLDYMNWIMGNKLPNIVSGTGGRQSKPWDSFGNIFDHFAIEYDYGNGVKGMHFARQQNGTDNRNSVEVLGSKGNVNVNIMSNYNIYSDQPYEFKDPINNMYQVQHDELFAAVRSGNIINDGEFMANSTILAIWGKVAAYTGKRISLEEILNSNETLGPNSAGYNWDMEIDKALIARPGKTKFV